MTFNASSTPKLRPQINRTANTTTSAGVQHRVQGSAPSPLFLSFRDRMEGPGFFSWSEIRFLIIYIVTVYFCPSIVKIFAPVVDHAAWTEAAPNPASRP